MAWCILGSGTYPWESQFRFLQSILQPLDSTFASCLHKNETVQLLFDGCVCEQEMNSDEGCFQYVGYKALANLPSSPPLSLDLWRAMSRSTFSWMASSSSILSEDLSIVRKDSLLKVGSLHWRGTISYSSVSVLLWEYPGCRDAALPAMIWFDWYSQDQRRDWQLEGRSRWLKPPGNYTKKAKYGKKKPHNTNLFIDRSCQKVSSETSIEVRYFDIWNSHERCNEKVCYGNPPEVGGGRGGLHSSQTGTLWRKVWCHDERITWGLVKRGEGFPA